jgi:16S rRNA (guanine527-N7)-methyltransferase
LSPSPHRSHIEALGVEAAAVGALDAYLELLAAWSHRVNLTGARTPAARVDVLVAGVLPAVALLQPGSLLDVGSGNGSPGLVLALLRPPERTVLLEPRRRRWAFLREAARLVGRPDIEILKLRHDEYQGPASPNVTLRALALPLEGLVGLTAPGGRLLVFGASPRTAPGWIREPEMEPPRTAIRVFRRERST